MTFDSLLPHRRRRQSGERYELGIPGEWKGEVEAALKALISEAQQASSPFTPDDLAAELTQTFECIARSPRAAPALKIYSEDETPKTRATHVLPGRIINVWYCIWDAEEFVWLRIEPSAARGHFV